MAQELDKLKQEFAQYVRNLQSQIEAEMLALDPKLEITSEPWQRQDFQSHPGGGGLTKAFSGELFENAGVNTSEIYGVIDPQFADKLQGSGNELWATGISLILHPKNPKIPTVHANFRMIHQGDRVWFGGGADLTPFYPFEDDFKYFHGVWKEAAGEHYPKMKATCDDYFTNHHRLYKNVPEMRGIGGIFFDHYNSGDLKADFNLVTHLGDHFIKSYFPIVKKRLNESYDQEDEDFQLHRRGRYVEFNLLHDRGTLFGLKTKGRIDSILISLPARCKYSYCYAPKVGSPHEKMMDYYRPVDWV